jgi:UDP-glucuronate 4-epimerase
MMEIQPGDASATHADRTSLEEYIGFKPGTAVEDGVTRFTDWHKKYNSRLI